MMLFFLVDYIEPLFVCVLTIWIFSLMKCLLKSFAHFPIAMSVSFLLIYSSSLHILDLSQE